ncbi:MAG: hypothetical protein ABI851_06170 [Saprospiraceae bacterium]
MSNPIFKMPIDPNLQAASITLKNGKELPVNLIPESKQRSYELEITEENEEGFILRNKEGKLCKYERSSFNFHKKVIKDGKIILNYHEYRDFFIFGRGKTEKRLFLDNFSLIFKNRKQIYSDSRFFLIRIPDFLHTEGVYSGKDDYCLGGLIESWDTSNVLITENENTQNRIYIIHGGGSQLSGSHSWVGWCEETHNFIGGWGNRGRKPPSDRYVESKLKFLPLWLEWRDISLRYPDYSNVDIASIEEFIGFIKALNN